MAKGGYIGGSKFVRLSPLLHGRDAASPKKPRKYRGPKNDVREQVKKDILSRLKRMQPTKELLARLARKAQDFNLIIPEIAEVAEAHGITGYEPRPRLLNGTIKRDEQPPSADELAVARAEARLKGRRRGRRQGKTSGKPGGRVFVADPNWDKPKGDR
jgi:hypothetical protein